MKTIIRNITLFIIFVTMSVLAGCGGDASSPVTNVTSSLAVYYVDSISGNDNNDGLSPNTAWKSLTKVNATTFQAGSTISFKAGCMWTGQLYPKGSGTGGNPITIDMYGSGNKPVIAGGGTVADTFYLYNQQYWVVKNLEITNDSASAGKRKGVHIVAQNIGTCNFIHLQNLYVHHVKGDNTDKLTGGIVIEVLGNVTPTKFNDVLIDGCTVKNVDRTGIETMSYWQARGGHQSSGGVWTPSTNLVVSNNVLEDIGGDGIVIRHATAPLIQYNVASNCNNRANTYNAAFWPGNADDAVFQYNEAYLTHLTQDGQGFDCDYDCNRTIIQYNYSHDNEGGFLLVCCNGTEAGSFNRDSVIRYNISQNDGINGSRIFHITGNTSNTKIYNNTIYLASGSVDVIRHDSWGGYPNGTQYYNNIFYNLGFGGYTFGSSTDNVFDYNAFYGNHPATEPVDAHKLTSDPRLMSPGSGGIGRDSVGGYKLSTGSPALGSGKLIPDNGGKDYWGNGVSSTVPPNRGAYNGTGI